MEKAKEKPVGSPEAVDPYRCAFYLLKKKRLCRLRRLVGQRYCAEHVPATTSSTKTALTKKQIVLERQPCPLDPKHTVAIGRLPEHLKKCNSRPPSEKDYYQPSANVATKCEDDGEDLNILTMTQEEKVDLILKLINFHKDFVPSIPNHFGIHEILMTDFVRTDVGESAIRHTTQIGAIVKIIDDHDLLKDSTCFIEFGSGKEPRCVTNIKRMLPVLTVILEGGLTYGLARVAKDRGLKNCKFILIDRASPRYKRDNRTKNSDYDGLLVERIKISIEHLVVGELPGIKDYQNIVGLTKHLCGSGTDVALRSLLNEKSNSERSKVKGFVFATCCHHRTEYKDFVGNELLTADFSGPNFRALRQFAGWATNGDYTSTYLKDISTVSMETLRFLGTLEDGRYPEIKLKKTIGRLVKEIMDHCRSEHVKATCEDVNITCKLVNYVDISTTRENVAIVAYPKS